MFQFGNTVAQICKNLYNKPCDKLSAKQYRQPTKEQFSNREIPPKTEKVYTLLPVPVKCSSIHLIKFTITGAISVNWLRL